LCLVHRLWSLGSTRIWLDHFIKYNNCGPDQPWHILLIDGATCHEAPNFIIKEKMNHIWILKFPSHQTHLIQPLDVGCFRTWKHYQQSTVMNAIRSFEPEYNIQSFFRDLPRIRSQTFKVSTIKHSFANAGIWPVSFKAVKRKLKEYGKKKRRDTGLDALEFGSEPSSESDIEQEQQEPVPAPQLIEEYQLPLLKPPISYDECRRQLQELESKAQDTFSSPSRAQASITIQATNVFLMRGSLHEMEVTYARAGAIATHKRKLDARKSLAKGGSITASNALQKIKDKRRKEADDNVRKAQTAITRTENKARNMLKERGIQARKDERARLLFIQQHQALGAFIPDEMRIPIRDPEKQPTSAETDALRANQSLYDHLEQVQKARERAYSDDPAEFTDIPIDPAILEHERQFRVQQQGVLNQLTIQLDADEQEGSEVEPFLHYQRH
jgi:DDE superfamily endonuclease